jgi:CHASE2 domain-containing sensor protein
MDDEWRNTRAGILLPLGAVIVIVCLVLGTGAELQPFERVLWLLPALVVIVVATIWSTRVLRRRGKRAQRGPAERSTD